MIKHTILAVLTGLIGFGLYLSYYVGAFRKVEISEGEASEFILLGRSHIGAYHKIVPTIQEVETWAKSKGLPCAQSFGLYEDNPAQVEEERLRSFGGCVVTPEELTQIQDQLPEKTEIRRWGAPWFVKAVFEGSPGIGPFKVYPKVAEWMKDKKRQSKSGVVEVYRIHGGNEMTTVYYFPVEKPLNE